MENNILEKALKLKIAYERGDIQVRDFAKKKYDEFLMDNLIDHREVVAFEKKDLKPKDRKFVEINGQKFYTKEEVKKYYDTLSAKEKVLLAIGLLKNKK